MNWVQDHVRFFVYIEEAHHKLYFVFFSLGSFMKIKCIEEEILVDYLENHLSEKRRGEVENHIAECENCLDVIALMGEMRQDDLLTLEPVPENVTRQAITKVTDLSEDSIPEKLSGYLRHLADTCSDTLARYWSLKTPVSVAVRGKRTNIADEMIYLSHSFLDLKAEIEIEKKDNTNVCIRVNLTRKGGPFKAVRISLFRKGREIASYLDHCALFEDLPFGKYVLKFTVFDQNMEKIEEYPIQAA